MSHNKQRTGRDRRSESRFRINEAARLLTAGIDATVTILDISAIDLRVTSPGPIPRNTTVEIQIGCTKIFGVVKNCRYIRAAEFHVGIVARPASNSNDHHSISLDQLPIYRRARLMNGGVPIDRRLN